jgi:hypothetical protein
MELLVLPSFRYYLSLFLSCLKTNVIATSAIYNDDYYISQTLFAVGMWPQSGASLWPHN